MIFVEIAAAMVTVVVTLMCARGVIRRNRFVGVRTRATMRDDESWIRGHRAAAVPTSISAIVTVSAGVTAVLLGMMNDVVAVLICAAILVAGALWGAAASHRALG